MRAKELAWVTRPLRTRERLTKINDELDDLETGDPLLPPDTDATRALEVVPVHDDVDSQVKGDGNPRDGGRADQLGVAEKSSGAMVVAVEESCKMLGIVVRHRNFFFNGNVLRGFFLRNKKQVSRSSRYLVR